MSNRTPTFGALALALSLAACGGNDHAADAAQASSAEARPEEASVQSPEGTDASQPGQQAIDLARVGYNEGDLEGALLRVIEFSDFGCVFCAGFHIDTYPALYDEFMVSGQVVWKYIPITIGRFPNGVEAALAGECGGMLGDFATMRDHLFETREEWLESSDPDALFVGDAEVLGYDPEAFAACYEGSDARDRLAAANHLADQLGVRATPTFLVAGHPVEGAPPLEAFQEVLRELLEQAREGS